MDLFKKLIFLIFKNIKDKNIINLFNISRVPFHQLQQLIMQHQKVLPKLNNNFNNKQFKWIDNKLCFYFKKI